MDGRLGNRATQLHYINKRTSRKSKQVRQILLRSSKIISGGTSLPIWKRNLPLGSLRSSRHFSIKKVVNGAKNSSDLLFANYLLCRAPSVQEQQHFIVSNKGSFKTTSTAATAATAATATAVAATLKKTF